MKKTVLSLSLLFPALFAQAQPVLLPNGDFENWTNVSYNDPAPWFNSNEFTIPDYGFACVTRVAGTSGMYAVRLETKAVGTDTSAGFISNSDDDILNGEGGVPYTLKAIRFHGTYRYNIISGDTAWIFVIFKKNGNVISDNLYPITGSQSTATPFTLPVFAMSQTPDSIIIAALSSNVLNANPKAGSWLELDALSFDDGIVYVPAPDGDFENWVNHNIDNATGWINQGLGEVTKSSTPHTGNFAVKMVSKDDGTGYIDEAYIQLGLPQQMPGMPFTKKVDTLTGYYKYNGGGTDKGVLVATLTDANGMPLGAPVTRQFSLAANYTYFEVPLSSTVTPAILMVDIMSSDYSGTPVDGSTLYIDNLRLKNTPAGIGRIENNSSAFSVFPNPAKNTLYIKPAREINEAVTVRIYDMAGREISNNKYNSTFTGHIRVPLDGFVPGVYQYEIQSGDVSTRGKFVKE